MEFKCCEYESDTLEVSANDPSNNNTVFVKVVEGDSNISCSLALSPESAVKLAKELIKLAEGK